jgi:tetratricopeptide (TPR) repeat protein
MKNTSKSGPDEKNNVDAFDAQELFALARIDMERGALEQALQKIKRLIIDPNVPSEAYGLAGRLYAQLGLWDRAKELFQKYLQLNPKAVTEAFQLGMVHFDAGQTDEALKAWSDLLQKHPTHPPALFYRALALAQAGKTADARQNLDVLLKSIPNDNLYFGRGKELLQSLDSQPASVTKPTAQKESFPGIAKDAYKTEH